MMWTMAKKTTKRWEEYDYDKIMMDNDKEDNNTNDSLVNKMKKVGWCMGYWHERAAFQRSSFGRSRSGGRLLAMT